MTRDYRTRRAIVVTESGTHYGQGRTTQGRPDQDALLVDLLRLLNGSVIALTETEGVLMIGGGKTVADLTPPAPGSGWTYTQMRPWTTFLSAEHGRIVHVGVLADIDPDRSPLFHPNDAPDTIASMLDRWHALTGSPWHATGGVVGCGALRRTHGRPGKGAQPLWRWTLPAGVRGAGPLVWGGDAPAGAAWVHVFDVNAQYLAALRNAPLAWGPLEHTGDAPYDLNAAGFWRIYAANLPAALTTGQGRPPVVPAGLTHKGEAWVSAPVMRYLCQIGYNPEVLDSWSTGNVQTLARSYAERLSAVRTGMVGDVPKPVAEGVKRVYTETVGMLGREGGRVFRRDWQIGIMDLARMNLQRRLDRAADLLGLWPFRVRTDAVYYATDDPSPEPLGAALGLGRGPGTFRHVRSLPLEQFAEQDSDARAFVATARK